MVVIVFGCMFVLLVYVLVWFDGVIEMLVGFEGFCVVFELLLVDGIVSVLFFVLIDGDLMVVCVVICGEVVVEVMVGDWDVVGFMIIGCDVVMWFECVLEGVCCLWV